ncbi:hypothetical protein [Halarchaeum salinum]|uniref:DUF7847 domain-containing protein n=1 Tax=Halarchaeum salinum TaxID=489912 RepID=A0AAV3S9Z9_9EURY
MSSTASLPDDDAGALDILRAALGVLRDSPGIVAIYVVLALVTALSSTLGNFGSIIVLGLAIVLAARTLGLDGSDASNSLGVRLLLVLVAGIVAGIGVVIGYLFLVLPGIYLTLRLRLVAATVMLEDSGPIAALSRSFDLTEGHTWTVFGVWLVVSLVGLAVGGAVVLSMVPATSLTDPTALQPALRVASAASTLLTGPVVAASDAVMFGLFRTDDAAGADGTAGDTDDVAPNARVADER